MMYSIAYSKAVDKKATMSDGQDTLRHMTGLFMIYTMV